MFGFYGPVLLGLCLSTAIELTQLYTPNRDTNLLDVISNVTGSVLGVALAALFEKIAAALPSPLTRLSRQLPVDRGALMLAFCWVAWLVFPFFPIFGHTDLLRKLSLFANAPVIAPVPLLSAAAVWFTAGLLIAAAGIRRPVAWLGVSLLAIPAQFFIVERQPVPSDLLGALTGFLLFAWRPRPKPVTKTEAWSFSVIIVLRGLSPFQFVSAAADFIWIPFAGMLNAEWQFAVLVLIEKTFYYATSIWLLRAAGMRLLYSVVVVAAFLTAIEIAQTHLPGRTSETIDPLLALFMGFVLFVLSRETGTRFQSTE